MYTPPTNLMTQNSLNPKGININTPVFNWAFNGSGDEKGFRVLVASSLKNLNNNMGDMWDTGHIWQWHRDEDDKLSQITYTGKTLVPDTTYYWKVKTWEGGHSHINGGNNESPYSEYATFHTSSSLIDAKENLKNLIFSDILNNLYYNTLYSLRNRVNKSGFSLTSLTGVYGLGMFIRDACSQIDACFELNDYETIEKLLRYMLENQIHYGKTQYAAHIVFNYWREPDMDEQIDGNYCLVAEFSRYLNETGDTKMENDFYWLIRNFTQYPLDMRYNEEYKLLFNSRLEHSRKPVHVPAYDTVANIWAVRGLELIIPIAKRRGENVEAERWNTYSSYLLEGLTTSLGAEIDGKEIYGELRWYPDITDLVYGMSWVNLTPIATGYGNVDWGKMDNTIDVYMRQASFMFGDYRMLMTHASPGRVNQTVPDEPQFAVIGKGLAWEMLHATEKKDWNRLFHMNDYLKTYNTIPLYQESTWWENGGPRASDGGNQEQASWFIRTQTKLRNLLTELCSDDFRDETPGNPLANWIQEKGTWKVFAGPNACNVVRNDISNKDAILSTGQEMWSDYTVSANVKAACNEIANTTSGYIGIGGRYMNNNRFYALLFKDGKIGLYKSNNGWIELASIKADIILDKWYNMQLRFEGSTIAGYLDMERILTATDIELMAGKAILLSKDTDARFGKFAARENVKEPDVPITLYKPSISQNEQSAINGPTKAVDANPTNNSLWSADSYPQWWQVDLANNYLVDKIVIRNYVDGIRYYKYDIQASIDAESWETVASKTDESIATDVGDSYDIKPTKARFLRVNINYNGAEAGAQISAFRAYGLRCW